MKSLHSPSSSSSSSTSETRPNYATNGCLSSILRRFLGFHTLPTLPFDEHVNETFQCNEFKELKPAAGNPGIVAKLMGLDSMPLELRNHRLLQAPRFVELENDKFIILSFEGGGKDKELKLSSSKKRIRKNQETQKFSCELLDLKSEFDSKKLCDTDFDSEKSSPVSVLEFPDHQEASHSGKEDSKTTKNSNLRRKLRGDLDKNFPSSSSSPSSSSPSSSSRSCCNSTDVSVESSSNGKKCGRSNKNHFRIGDFHEMWEEVSEMAKRDTIERWKGEDIEEIGVCFGLQILDELILELFTTPFDW